MVTNFYGKEPEFLYVGLTLKNNRTFLHRTSDSDKKKKG